ncbi:pentapeptide repeat-containing protein [Streptomyces sp. NPDC005820]|uniref:pentapeptide repeat-containing protein n=1 Tax=Streptomyces sp. NPDC005820 TaxID=3157069 RepID=UPI0033F26473
MERARRRSSPQHDVKPAADFQAALTVLGRRPRRRERFKLNLRDADLRGANLVDARLDNASLDGARLEDAKLARVSLRNASLVGAHLERAVLVEADLKGARLDGAYLQDAVLNLANLRDVSAVARVHFEGAQLNGADLRSLWIDADDIIAGKPGESTKLPPSMTPEDRARVFERIEQLKHDKDRLSFMEFTRLLK